LWSLTWFYFHTFIWALFFFVISKQQFVMETVIK
jgi:hypothetical protein